MGLTVAQYILQPFFPNCNVPDDCARLIAALSISELFIWGAIYI